MATEPISASPFALTPPVTPVPPAAISRVLSRFDREQLAGFVAIAIDLMDLADPDPDLEDATDLEDDFALSPQAIGDATGPGCEVSDGTGDQVYVEWVSHRAARSSANCILAGEEDDEDDDSDQAHDEGEPDLRRVVGEGPGCPISDPDFGIDDQRCDEPYQDLEQEQMQGDVPMLPVFAAAHSIFTDQRVSLGIGNLRSSFRTNGGEVRSADTVQPFRSRHDGWCVPTGVPV